MYVHRGDTYPWVLTAFPTKAGVTWGECPKATGENGQGSPCLSFKEAALYKTLMEVSKIGTTVSPSGSFQDLGRQSSLVIVDTTRVYGEILL